MDAKKIHQIDQETGPLHELAFKLAAYHRSLMEAGFRDDQAMQVVCVYQSTLIITVTEKGEDHGR